MPRGQSDQPLLFWPQMKLCKEGIILQSRACHALADSGEGLRSIAHAGFILRGKKKWTEKRAVDPVAKRQLGILQFLKKVLRKIGRLLKQRPQKLIPGFNPAL